VTNSVTNSVSLVTLGTLTALLVTLAAYLSVTK
jgi:hypothetical protein